MATTLSALLWAPWQVCLGVACHLCDAWNILLGATFDFVDHVAYQDGMAARSSRETLNEGPWV